MAGLELTYMARQWKSPEDPPPLYGGLMASSEVDRKFLGHFAKTTLHEHGYLSSFLFRILGLSVVLSEDLLSARRAKRLDPVRDSTHRRLVHHILWLAREGLVMMEQYVLPMLGKSPNELRVLAFKLKASLYHIFVLFHNDPAVNDRINRRRSGSGSLFPQPLSPKSKSSSESPTARQRSPAISLGTGKTPPGLPLPSGGNQVYMNGSRSNGTATFLLPLQDYRPIATAAFRDAHKIAAELLPGSHPIRLSVEVEYVAYIYDCLHEADQSRRRAKAAVRAVYEAQEGMDDESFVDASELVSM
ncbi:uncharacterized protein HMPREF1541_09110 [Cyphellophora europaea CBS 101466]|uniref:14-3-3 domain-containing protein n=1 Tax=Cyphellophora europaea (strain CBS 101466) TaxID=1220924 RepID=W2SBH5_CYPE1|nr:uncharacterized protein HMPREF1541_09110 [Cyphellophora europaea CBS 101466]ETN45279.1 hypothetical protein HMPREF1541_09110 [Cyphellophora europaea CBS 101466]